MEQEKQLTEQESLALIAATIQEAKAGYYHDSGLGAIFWGCVVGVAGLATGIEQSMGWNSGFDWWLLTIIALVPQLYYGWRQGKKKLVKTHMGSVLNTVWSLFGIGIFLVILYHHVAPAQYMAQLSAKGYSLQLYDAGTQATRSFVLSYPPSASSLIILLFAFPTIVVGVAQKNKHMRIGGLVTLVLYVVSLYTPTLVDNYLMGLAGIINWLIPGLLMRRAYQAQKKAAAHV